VNQWLVDHNGEPETCGSHYVLIMHNDSFKVKLLL